MLGKCGNTNRVDAHDIDTYSINVEISPLCKGLLEAVNHGRIDVDVKLQKVNTSDCQLFRLTTYL